MIDYSTPVDLSTMRTAANDAEIYGRYFDVVQATTPGLVRQVYRLRYQVYCVEHPFEKPPTSRAEEEVDQYDSHSVHAALVHKPTGDVCGCVRLILPRGSNSLPITKLIPERAAATLIEQRSGHVAEVSRYAVSKAFRRRASESEYADLHFGELGGCELRRLVPHITVGLMLAVALLSVQNGITHIAALMRPALLRLLRSFGMEFIALGPLIQHHGMRQPCFAQVGELMTGVRARNASYFDFIERGLRHADQRVVGRRQVSASLRASAHAIAAPFVPAAAHDYSHAPIVKIG